MDKVKAKKHLGQHFLTNIRFAEKLAELVVTRNEENVLEIGPGMGVLTQFLFQKKNLTVVEIDTESVAYLKQHYSEIAFIILEADFLKLSLDTFTGPFIICGNFPYNISSQIVFKMLEYHEKIPFMCGMFQLEMARRIAAAPNNKDYGILSVLTQYYYNVKLEFIIEPGAFNPPPKVRSAVISCNKKEIPHEAVNKALFFKVVKAAFNQRRKMLGNALAKLNIPREAILNHEFAKLRAENLSVQDFTVLTNYVAKFISK